MEDDDSFFGDVEIKTITGRLPSEPEIQWLVRRCNGPSTIEELRKKYLGEFPQTDLTHIENRMVELGYGLDFSKGSDETVITKTTYKGGYINVEHIPFEDYYELWDESHHPSPKARKATYDFLHKDRSIPMETPVSSPPKLTQAQRAKLNAKRKLNRQNRKRARK